MLNRRSFIQRLVAGLAGTAVAAELDLERLLWVPKPMIVVPEMPGSLNTFASIDWVTRECLRLFEKQLSFANLVGPQYDIEAAATRLGEGHITHGVFYRADESDEGVEKYGIEKAILEPAAELLADEVKRVHREVTTFGVPAVLPLYAAKDCAVVVNHKTGTAMRGARIYDIQYDRYDLRFDILTGGKS